MATPLTKLSDIVFWSRQLSEHALFFSMGLEVAPYKTQASSLHDDLERARAAIASAPDYASAAGAAYAPVQNLSTWQQGVMSDLETRWLGWLPPLFWDHTLQELRYFTARVWGSGMPPGVTLAENLRFMREHAEFAAHLLDPTAEDLIAEAQAAVASFRSIEANCCAKLTPVLLDFSRRAGEQLDRYFTGNPIASPTKGVIHPVLADHVVREGRRFLETLPTLE